MTSQLSDIQNKLHGVGIYPYGSQDLLDHEKRLTKVLTAFYEKSKKSGATLDSLNISTCEGPIAEKTNDLMHQHYNYNIEFFRNFLDSKFLAYSMAFYGETAKQIIANECTIEEAQRSKFELFCRRAKIVGTEKVIDFGCGFGSLATFLLEKYPKIRVVGVTPSKVQINYIRNRMEGSTDVLGQERFQLVEDEFDSISIDQLGRSTFDVVFSVGVLEHVKNMRKALKGTYELLKPGGRSFHHLIVSRHTLPQFLDTKLTGTRKYFPGGRIWPFDMLEGQVDSLDFKESWFVNGMNYWRTVDEWHRRFWMNIDQLYDKILDDNEVRYWNEYFSYSKTLFAPFSGEIAGNGQYLFQRSKGS